MEQLLAPQRTSLFSKRSISCGPTSPMTGHQMDRIGRGRLESSPANPLRQRGRLPFTVLSDPIPLIGRDRELEVLRQHLLSEGVHVLTVTGPGGVGKTRLAVAAARCVEADFPDGVWFIDLLPLQDPAQIDNLIAHALQLTRISTRRPLCERVTAYLMRRRVLLVLDNFEHILPAAARVAELATTCPYLKVLVTSREPLRLRLEQRMVLAGLALPNLARSTPDVVAQAASGRLFLDRALRVQPDLSLTPVDARALAELLHRLDGIPLAIQIAAARINVLSPGAMLERLQGQALLSTEEARDAPARHHTLRNAIEWSHALLDKGEEELFQQLAVFAGGWTLEAAEAIVQRRAPRAPLWQTLQSLVEKSLVQTDAVGGADRRYRMLETVRDYALERLAASGELDTTRQRHADYYLGLAEQAEREWYGPEEKAWLFRIEQEHDNVEAVLRWTETKQDGQLSLRIAGALAEYWWVGDYLREGRRWLEQALAMSPNAPTQLRAKALVGAGLLVCWMGDGRTARALLQQALELAAGDPVATARALARLGLVAMYEDEARSAEVLLERSFAIHQAGSQRWQAATLFMLGIARMRLGDLDRAEATLMESLDLSRTVGNRRCAMAVTTYLAQIKLKQGDDAGAAALAADALRYAPEVLQPTAQWAAVTTAALVSAHRNDIQRSVRLLAAVEEWSASTGHVFPARPPDRETRAEIMVHARRQMGDAAYETAVREGQALSVDDAVDYARAGFESIAPGVPEPAAAAGAERASPQLSNREQAVLRLIAEGLLNKQIATALGVAERTVKTYVASAMKKLGADNRAHAVVAALQRGLIE
jgi:predicted ATPase/DNA-binding CsgD family transcriptional regulator